MITMSWMININIQSSMTLWAVLSYISKYMLKSEKLFASYINLQMQVLLYINNYTPLLLFVLKMLNKLIDEQNWSAQKVFHILLQLSVQHFSQMLVSLNCHSKDVQQKLIILELSEVTAQRSLLWRYWDQLKNIRNRNVALFDLSLYNCL